MRKHYWAIPAIVMLVANAPAAAVASEIVYHPVNPTFGGPIFQALSEPDIFRTELVAASGLAILLALAADSLLALAQRALTPWSRLG